MTKEATAMIVKVARKEGIGTGSAQRKIFKLALENGWPGKEPSVLDSYSANMDLEWAVDYLRRIINEEKQA